MNAPMFSIAQLLDIAEAEGRVKYEEGFRAGLAAAEEHHAATLEQDAAEAVDAELHARAVAVMAGLSGHQARSWQVLGIDPVTATPEQLADVAAFRREYGIERFRAAIQPKESAA